MCVARKNSTGCVCLCLECTDCNHLCACVIKKDSVLKYKEYLFKDPIRAAWFSWSKIIELIYSEA